MTIRDEHNSQKSESVLRRNRAYDLVAIDIDGTLVTSENRLSGAVAAAIRATRASGVGVTLVSGRAQMKVVPLLNALGLTLPYISSGGAHVIDPANNLTILYRSLEPAICAAIAHLARAAQVAIITQIPDRLFYEGSLADLERLRMLSKLDSVGVDNAQVEISRVDDVLQASPEPGKLTLYGEPDLLMALEKKLQLLNLPIYPTYSIPIYLEITPAGVNKGEALKLLAAYLALPLERILVIGDGKNDRSMFEIAGMAVAMSNAPEEVKASADLVAPSNDEDGVAWALRELILKEQERYEQR